jgi:hypothetical protein
LEDLSIEGNLNTEKSIKGIGCEVVDWIHVALDSVQWWSFVNTVMNFQFP